MTGARRRVVFAAAALAMGAAAVGIALRPGPTKRERVVSEKRPALLLLTSLPLIFNEDFTLKGTGSPALQALRSSFHVIPISVADRAELGKGGLLLMAQPFAQTPENLVILDAWVRRGGRVLLLADPWLEWPSKRPLGDPTRPPPMFTDTGLLGHWGVHLAPPDVRGVIVRRLGTYRVATVSPGRLSGACKVRDDGLDARCRIGKGEAIIIADADFLNTPALGKDGERNLDALLEQLTNLQHP